MSTGDKERGIKADKGDPATPKAQGDQAQAKLELISVSSVNPWPARTRCPAKTNAGGPERVDRVENNSAIRGEEVGLAENSDFKAGNAEIRKGRSAPTEGARCEERAARKEAT